MATRSAGPRPVHLAPHGVPRRAIAFVFPVLVLALGTAVRPCAAAVFHVDAANPACSANGPGTAAQPYCTITAAALAHHAPGDTILVGQAIYREQVSVPGSGAAGSPLVILANGDSVVVDGSDDFSSTSLWAPFSEDVYHAATVTWDASQVFMDGVRLTPSTAAPEALPESSFRWVSDEGLYVNAGGGNPGLHQLWVGRRLFAFSLNARSWVTIDGFVASHVEDIGINVGTGCSKVVVANNRVSFANTFGIRCNNSTEVLIENNVVSDNNYHGIGLTAGSSGCTVRGNESFRNVDPAIRRANGIYLHSSISNTLAGNRVHDNQDSGIHFAGGSHDCLSQNNRSWNNGDHGFDHLGTSGTSHIHDVAFGNFKDGFSVELDSPNTRLTNCISVDNGITTNRFDLWVDASSTVGFVSDYNIIWNSTSRAPFKYIATEYSTLAAYQAASGQDAHSLQANPSFVNGPAGDFHPTAGSPAIDAANSGVTGWPATDAEGNGRVDAPAVPNTGAGPVPHADRGALEFQTDQAPVVIAPAGANVAANDTLTVAITASDPDGDAIDSLTVAGLPPGATFTPDSANTGGTLTWIPGEADVGPHGVSFTAHNALAGTDTTVIAVTGNTTGVPGDLASGPSWRGVAPNPFRVRGHLRFALARDGDVRVQVFDLAGRVVRTLLDRAHAPAGEYDLAIDAGSGSGEPLRSGLYFYRIQTPQGVTRGRFVVLE